MEGPGRVLIKLVFLDKLIKLGESSFLRLGPGRLLSALSLVPRIIILGAKMMPMTHLDTQESRNSRGRRRMEVAALRASGYQPRPKSGRRKLQTKRHILG